VAWLIGRVAGTILNALAILVGGVAGLTFRRQIAPTSQVAMKILLGAFTVYAGLGLTWQGLNGTVAQVLKQALVVLGALMLGNLTGKALGLQKAVNRLGKFARGKFDGATSGAGTRFSDGFLTCAVLFCAAPLAVLGPVSEALGGSWKPLAVKAVMDGLATMAFVGCFGWGVVLSVVPVVAFQGTLWLLVQAVQPHLGDALANAVTATAGLLVFCVSLIVLEIKKVELADYLPSLAFAPLLTWLFS
jgi:uncharacterized protein